MQVVYDGSNTAEVVAAVLGAVDGVTHRLHASDGPFDALTVCIHTARQAGAPMLVMPGDTVTVNGGVLAVVRR